MKYVTSLIVVISIIALLVIFNKNPNSATAKHINLEPPTLEISAETHQIKMLEIIDCAGLIANASRINKTDFSAGSETFQQVTYSLGQAEAHAMDAGLSSGKVKSLYDKKTLHYYILLSKKPQLLEQDFAPKIQECQQHLRLYNPETQMRAVMEKAQKMRIK